MDNDCNTIYRVDSHDLWIVLLLIGLFVGSRILWLLLNPFSAGYFEEAYRWVATQEFLNKPVLPFLEYQADHYQGGSLVMILLNSFYFLLFGKSIISFKLAALTFSVGVLVMLYVTGRMFFGRLVGVVAAACYLTGPPLPAFWGLVVMGNHGESIFFSLLQIFIFLGILSGQWRTSLGLWLFGIVSGFGIWFCYTTGLSLFACVLCFLLLKGFPKRNELIWIAFGFFIGVSPWFIYNFQYDFAGIARIMEMFGFGNPVDNWIPVSRFDKLISFFVRDYPLAIMMPYGFILPGIIARLLVFIFSSIFGVAFIMSVIRITGLFRKSTIERLKKTAVFEIYTRQREIVFVAYAFIFVFAYILSNFTLSKDVAPVIYRLFNPLTVIILIPFAVTVVHVLKKKNKLLKYISCIGVVIFLTTSATATVVLAMRPPSEDQLCTDEHRGYVVMGAQMHRKYENNLERALSIANQYSAPEKKKAILQGIGWGLEFRYEKDGRFDELYTMVKKIPYGDQLYILQGIDFFGKASSYTVNQYINGQEQENDKHFMTIRDRLLVLLKWVAQERAILEKCNGRRISSPL
jgi:hypothetical protein